MRMRLVLLMIVMKLFRGCMAYSKRRWYSSAVSKIPLECKANEHSANELEHVVFKQLVEVSSKRSQSLSDISFILSVSGGSDSIAMLHIFNGIKANLCNELDFQVIHFNHKKRLASEEEEKFVQDVTRDMKVECTIKSWNINKQQTTNNNFQSTAREWRRKECANLANIIEVDKKKSVLIALAHNKEDQIETLLLKFVRGVHLTHFNPMRSYDGEQIIRPLLSVPKISLQKYLQERNLTWKEDESNQSRDFKRNQIRHDLIPLLSELSGSYDALEKRLFAWSKQSEEVQEITNQQLSKLSKEVVGFSFNNYIALTTKDPRITLTSLFQSYPKLVVSQLVHDFVQETTAVSLDYEQAERILKLLVNPLELGRRSSTITIDEYWDFEKHGEQEARVVTRDILRRRGLNGIDGKSAETAWKVYQNGIKKRTTLRDGDKDFIVEHPAFLSVSVSEVNTDNCYSLSVNKKMLENRLIQFRSIEDGDRVHLRSSKNPSSMINLKKLLKRNFKLSSAERDRIIVLASRDETINEEVILAALINRRVYYFQPSSEYSNENVRLFCCFM